MLKRMLGGFSMVVLMAVPAAAATITVPPDGTWLAANDWAGAFWANASDDLDPPEGPGHIGYVLQNQLLLNLNDLEYLSASPVSAPQAFQIGKDGQNVELRAEIAGQAATNALYFNNGGADSLLFAGAAVPGASFAGPITGPFWFVFYPDGVAADTYATNSDTTFRQFVLFRSKSNPFQYYLGVEDRSLGGTSDRDYNDMVVSFTLREAQVPEPGAMLLLGLGLVGAAMRRRRRQ